MALKINGIVVAGSSPGKGVIPGGSAGQVLTKNTDNDYDFYWANIDPTKQIQIDDSLSEEGCAADAAAVGEQFNLINVKLSKIEDEAQKNVQSDWDETDSNSDAFIKNKPTLGKLASEDSVGKELLSSDVQTSLNYANTALQPNDIKDWAQNTIQQHESGENHSDIRGVLNDLKSKVETLLDIQDIDQLSELVHFINENHELTNKINKTDVINNLNSEETQKPLSAKQGKVLNDLIGDISTLLDAINGEVI